MEENKRLAAIVVVAEDGAIGRDGGLLCHLPADLRHFKDLTMGHSIVMGRRTFESFPKGALPGRQNIVITRNKHYHPQGVTVVNSVDEALQAVEMPGDVFIIGGIGISEWCNPYWTLAAMIGVLLTNGLINLAEVIGFAYDGRDSGWAVVAQQTSHCVVYICICLFTYGSSPTKAIISSIKLTFW